MNCVELAVQHATVRPDAAALCLPGRGAGGCTTFSQLLDRAGRTQRALRSRGIDHGDTILMLDGLGPRLYGTVMAALSLGAAVMLVEPWMPVAKIELAIKLAKPKLFVANTLGLIWGARIRSIREIGGWLAAPQLDRVPGRAPLHVESVEPTLPGIVTFTSGTTGNPKGVVRNQGYLVKQHEVLSRALEFARFTGTDLGIFANFVFANLASGRGTVLIPPGWKASHLRWLDGLPKRLQPETLNCGPGFLRRLMAHTDLPTLRSVHIGGALIDCQLFEAGFAKWPAAEWSHVYGSTEAEPVAVVDAKLAVQKSRERDYFHTLYLGHPVADIESELERDGVWVTGPHVCPRYLGDVEENRSQKREDELGRIWHFMGDRIRILDRSDGGWWYSGRSSQRLEDFELEQRIYSKLRSSKAFLHRLTNGDLVLIGEGLGALDRSADTRLAGITRCVELRIQRDRRHRARIDRAKTLARGPRWLRG